MAHLRKINLKEFKAIIGHDTRELYDSSYLPDNINGELTKNNFVVHKDRDIHTLEKVINENSNGRKLRDNTVVLGSWVIQAPKDLKTEDTKKFFRICESFITKRYGNIFNGYTHFDETTPHAHYLVMPLEALDRDVNGNISKYKFNAKKIFNQNDLKSFHTDLNRYVNLHLGYNVSILNGETLRNSKGKAVDVKQLKLMSDNNERALKYTQKIITETVKDLKQKDLGAYNSFKQSLETTLNKQPKSFLSRVRGFFMDLFHTNKKVKKEKELSR